MEQTEQKYDCGCLVWYDKDGGGGIQRCSRHAAALDRLAAVKKAKMVDDLNIAIAKATTL